MTANYYMIRYNLQLFAKDGPGGEKTEPATTKKLTDAREKGQVSKSKDIVSAVYLISLFALMRVLIPSLGKALINIFPEVYNRFSSIGYSGNDEINVQTFSNLLETLINDYILMMLPFFALAFIISFIGDLVQVKWKITSKPLQPKFSRMNPVSGFKRMFSKQSLVNLLKSLALLIVMGYVIINTILDNIGIIYRLYDMTLLAAVLNIGELVFDLGLKLSMIYLIIGFADLVFQKRKFNEDMKMTKQEVKDEYKNAEGDPKIKSQIRRKMLQVSQRRMMKELPDADVVITNPTHFAVALKYDLEIADAPVVIAKGADYLAQKIKEVARENKIEIVENKPLARSLYQSVEVGNKIPQELFAAVAEVLVAVYKAKNKIPH